MCAVVVGFWSQDAERQPFKLPSPITHRDFCIYKDEFQLWTELVETLTSKGQTVAVFEESKGCDEGTYNTCLHYT